MGENEQQISDVQKWLDYIADEIDVYYESATDEVDLNNKYIECLKILHARYSAAVYLIKKGVEAEAITRIQI